MIAALQQRNCSKAVLQADFQNAPATVPPPSSTVAGFVPVRN
jgi:hypothetical protein